MSRRNKNARSRGYSSFDELRDATLRFDLTSGTFNRKNKNSCGSKHIDADVTFFIGDNSRGGKMKYATFSVRDDLAETMIKGYGSLWTCGIVRQGAFERLYFIPDSMGYSLYDNKAGKRHYSRIRIDSYAPFEKYVGRHELKYDEYNKAYYILSDE